MPSVPIVDISDPSATSLAALDAACRSHGFFLLEGHGLDGVIDETFRLGREFFDGDAGVKHAVRRDERVALGYNDRELTKRQRDHKEVFDFVDPTQGRAAHHNRWPSAPDGFRAAMADHFDAFSELAARTTALVFAALDASAATIEDHRGDRTTSYMRLNRYTVGDPVPEHERAMLNDLAEVALGEHTDPGLLTLLIQDDTGGLQALSIDGEWIDVDPRPGTVVVNLADCMQVWTNDRYRAAVHRVQSMGSTDRMSIPYFSTPPVERIIEPISELVDDAPRYRPFVFRDFLNARGADNYADEGVDDVQVTDYRIVVGG
jgi:isopenicillin N synthase-like dioxygenase